MRKYALFFLFGLNISIETCRHSHWPVSSQTRCSLGSPWWHGPCLPPGSLQCPLHTCSMHPPISRWIPWSGTPGLDPETPGPAASRVLQIKLFLCEGKIHLAPEEYISVGMQYRQIYRGKCSCYTNEHKYVCLISEKELSAISCSRTFWHILDTFSNFQFEGFVHTLCCVLLFLVIPHTENYWYINV